MGDLRQDKGGHPMKRRSVFLDLIDLIRVRQWIKNFFVFFPLIFSVSFFSLALVVQSALAMLAFCFASSAGYMVNDVIDRDLDRRHPKKASRPVASGAVSVPAALVMAGVFCGLAAAAALPVGWPTTAAAGAYFLLSLAYSLWLKRVVLVDVMTIALLFALRVWGGALAINVSLSSWFILATLFLSIFMGFGKRRHDLLHVPEKTKTRPVLGQYDVKLLDYAIVVSIACIILTYALYTADADTVERFHTGALVYTVPVVVYGVFRYLFLVYKKENGGDPSDIVLRDKGLIIAVCLWLAAVIGIITLGHFGIGGID
jgi:decaprenyl-phosphate phosphoribosyltransferase